MSRAKILTIDDDLDLCLLLQRFLTRKGYEVVTAHSGAAGMATAKAQAFDLAITDFRLGDMEGSQLLAHFREHHPDQRRDGVRSSALDRRGYRQGAGRSPRRQGCVGQDRAGRTRCQAAGDC